MLKSCPLQKESADAPLAYGLVGLITGIAAGFWIGLMSGLIYADFAQVSFFDGQCRAVAVRIGAAGAALGGLSGTGFGLRRASGRGARRAAFSARSATHSIA